MIKPLGDRVLVQAIEKKKYEETTLIIIPEEANKDRPQQFRVLAIGDGEKATNLGVKVDDVVVMNRFAGSEVDDVDSEGKKIKVKIVLSDDVQGLVNAP